MSAANNVAKCAGNREDSAAAHAHLSGRTQFVLNCEWTACLLAPGSESASLEYEFTIPTTANAWLMNIIYAT